MAFLTEAKLSKTLDIPVSMPNTELKMGDWLTIATISLATGMKLSYQFLTFQMLSANVSTTDITTENKIVPALDFAFVGLYRNYSSGFPGSTPALDIVQIRESITDLDCVPINQISGQFITVRSGPLVEYTTPGVYTFIVANNMQSAANVVIPETTSIDFRLCVTGQIRLELEG